MLRDEQRDVSDGAPGHVMSAVRVGDSPPSAGRLARRTSRTGASMASSMCVIAGPGRPRVSSGPSTTQTSAARLSLVQSFVRSRRRFARRAQAVEAANASRSVVSSPAAVGAGRRPPPSARSCPTAVPCSVSTGGRISRTRRPQRGRRPSARARSATASARLPRGSYVGPAVRKWNEDVGGRLPSSWGRRRSWRRGRAVPPTRRPRESARGRARRT